MKRVNGYRMRLVLVGCVIALFALNPAAIQAQDGRPIADAGSSRYAGPDPIVLDGTGSYDPDGSGILSYTWRQISGPSVVIMDANTPTPTIAGSLQPDKGRGVDPTPKPQGFPQTDDIQECEFELIVRSAECESEPDIVKVVIVPMFPPNNMIVLENDFFDPNKPTFIWFEGAYSASNLCTGGGPWNIGSVENNQLWKEQANVISFSPYYADPGSTCGWNSGPNLTFSRCADIIIVYLSDVAPNYHQSIQTAGLSLGGIPAIDVALRVNQTYADARYAVNHVSFLDATSSVLGYAEYSKRVASFLDNPVDDEQCWFDSYVSAYGGFYPSALNVSFTTQDHFLAADWYHASLTTPESCDFNGGIVAGAYWSVIGPGKNLQLASTPNTQVYKFSWNGFATSGHLESLIEPPAGLPEPVFLIGPPDGAIVDANGVVLSCEVSKNAIGYQLLFGFEPYRVMDYMIVSDTPAPPTEVITSFPFDQTFWTVRVYDEFGSTIYADPICLYAENVMP